MNERTFNSRMAHAHETHASKALGIPRNISPGPDLLGKTTGVEVKSRLIYPGYPKKWVIHEHQLKYSSTLNDHALYWSLGFYRLSNLISQIHHALRDPEKLEAMVTERTLYLVPWVWMEQFSPHKTSGQTEISKWDSVLRYPTPAKLPETIKKVQAEKGFIYLTSGVDPTHFNFNTTV